MDDTKADEAEAAEAAQKKAIEDAVAKALADAKAEADADRKALEAKIAKLEKAKPADAVPGRPQFEVKGAVDPKDGSKEVKAAHSKRPKTYRALENGTDFRQGFIARGTIFTTTQPQGEWMEPVED